MRLERLEVRHLTSLGHVVIDALALPPGLIAITGENGTGKTTLLESAFAALYRTLPSRGGELVDYATDKDTTLDVRFAVDGVGAFHSRVNLDALRRTSEAVLEHQDVPLTDGKVSTYDAEVHRRFPSPAVMLASSMSAQNKRGNFISKKPKERKELFAELLALGHLEEMSQTAKTVVSLIDGVRDRLTATRTELLRNAGPDLRARQDADEAHIQSEMATLTGQRRRLAQRVDDLEHDTQVMAEMVRLHVAATTRANGLRDEFTARQAEQARLGEDSDLIERTYHADLKKLAEKAKTAKATTTAKIRESVQDLDKRIAAAKKVVTQAAAIRSAVAALETLTEKERILRAKVDAEQAEMIAATDARAALDQTLHLLAQPEHELTRAKQDAQLIEVVPFGARCAEAGCRFLKDAIAAQATVPDLERQLAGKPELVAKLAELTATITGLRAGVDALYREIVIVTTERDQHQALAALADKVTIAETRITELTETRRQAEHSLKARLTEMDTELADAQTELAARRTEAVTALGERASALVEHLVRLSTQVETADAAARESADGYTRGIHLQESLKETRDEWTRAGEALAALGVEQAALKQARKAFAEATARAELLTGKLAYLDTERTDWLQLQRALSRDGVPVLEMDAAGPHISELTNALLTSCFGPRFSVELVTQQAKASGSGMKESFELLVTDNERGGEPREVADLSGGEQVIISEALMNAIALYVNQRATMPVHTCWRDETTGALDPENGVRYFQMLRQVQTLGNYHHIFFVTHNPAIAAQADAQIHIADGGAEVRLPPYAAELAVA